MSKPYYAECVNHMLRFYAACHGANIKCFKTDVDKQNYTCVDNAINSFPQYERLILIDVYRMRGTLSDNVCAVSDKINVNTQKIWSLISDITITIARERRLI